MKKILRIPLLIIQILDSEDCTNMTLKSDFSKFSHIVPFKNLFGMTSKLTGIFFAASAQDSAQHIVGAQ